MELSVFEMRPLRLHSWPGLVPYLCNLHPRRSPELLLQIHVLCAIPSTCRPWLNACLGRCWVGRSTSTNVALVEAVQVINRLADPMSSLSRQIVDFKRAASAPM